LTRFYVGVSGFSYPKWRGIFYPEAMKSDGFLSYYSQRLRSVEVNSSFYAPPRESMIENWAQKTDGEFKFSFKAPQLITHITKLGRGSAEAANKFSTMLDKLGTRRGPVLFQLPPYMKSDLQLLADFIANTSEIEARVFEFRHGSWLEEPTYRLLEKNEVGFCVAETEEMEPVLRVTGKFAYFRLRKDSYSTKSVEGWAKRIGNLVKNSPESYVYLRHDETGENAVLAQKLSEKL
jgi:uncharacterized protein YecE (DUF72 family)